MTTFNNEEYFQILTEIIRENLVVPFSCFILLKTNNRAVCLVKSGHPFDQKILTKLKSFQFFELYVQISERPAYDAYLQEFFKGEEGKAVAKLLVEKNPDGNIPGVPDELLETVRLIGAEKTDEGAVTVKEPEKPDENAIVTVLQKQAADLEEKLKIKAALNPQEKQTLKDATEAINEEIERIKGIPDPKTDESVETIKNSAEKIKNEFKRVSGVVDKPGREFETLKQKTNAFQKKVNAFLEVGGENEDPIPDSGQKFRGKKGEKDFQNEIQQIKSLAESAAKDVATQAVEEIIQGLEKVIGAKIEIKSTGIEEKSGKAAEKLEKIKEEQAKVTFENTRKLDALKEKLEIQRRTIGLLNDRLKESKAQLTEVTSKWEEFNSRAQPTLGVPEKLAAKNFELHLRDLDTSYKSLQKPIESITENSGTMSDLMGVSTSFITKRTPDSVPGPTSPQHASPPRGAPSGQSLDLPPEADQNASSDDIRSENVLLRSQLENAKSLLDSSNDRLANLEQSATSHTQYTESLEKEVGQFKKHQELQLEKLLLLETKNNELVETATSMHRLVLRGKQEIQARDNALNQLRDQATYYESELKLLKDKFKDVDISAIQTQAQVETLPISPEYMTLLKSKDQIINQLNQKIETKTQEMRELEKENMKYKSALEENNQFKRKVAQKAERLEAEKLNYRQDFDALNRRLAAATNVLDTERKTVSKLTTMTEELKKERLDFMNKTNTAMKEFRSAMSKANSLTNNVQNEVDRNKKIQAEADKFKTKTRELMTRMGETEKEKRVLEAEVKKLKLLLEKLNPPKAA